MDGDHPIGSCRRGCNRSKGVSRVLLTYLAAERIDAQRRWHRITTTRQHFRHAQGGLASPHCDHCNAAGWSYPPA